jgi:phosphate-selective porin OprO and OprP
MRLIPGLITGALIGLQIGVTDLHGQDTNTLEVIRQLQKRVEELEQKVKSLEASGMQPPVTNTATQQGIEELDQKVKILERKKELDEENAAAKAKELPKIVLGERGFSFESANGNFGLQLKGVLQVDSRTFFDDGGTAGNDGFLLRRARPIMQGTVFRDFDFLFVPDFGGTGSPQIFDAYLNYRLRPELQFQVGKFKAPIGLEQLQADKDILFNERALPTDLVPNRDLGFELHGDMFGGVANYAVGIFNGIGDARNSGNADFQDDKAFAGRLFFLPFKRGSTAVLQGLGFGVSGSFEDMQGTNTTGLPNTTGGSLAGYATVGQQQFFAYNPTFTTSGTNRPVVVASGDHWRLSPQASYYYGPFGFLGEYVISDQQVSRTAAAPFSSAHLEHTAFQVAGSWVLTGEDASFSGVVPRQYFNPLNGKWGAWQLAARYSQLDIDPATFPLFSDPRTSASEAHEWSVGLNWYLNRNVRVSTSFSRTTFDGGGGRGSSAPATVTRQAENVLFTRVQLAF